MNLGIFYEGCRYTLEHGKKRGRLDALDNLQMIIDEYKEVVELAFSLRSLILKDAAQLLQGVKIADSRPVLFCPDGIETPIYYANFITEKAKTPAAPVESVAVQLIEEAVQKELNKNEIEAAQKTLEEIGLEKD